MIQLKQFTLLVISAFPPVVDKESYLYDLQSQNLTLESDYDFDGSDVIVVDGSITVQQLLQLFNNIQEFSPPVTFLDVKKLELNKHQTHSFIEEVKDSSKGPFIVSFQSLKDDSCSIYWKLKNKPQTFYIDIEKNSVEIADFVKKCLFQSLKSGHNGKYCMNEFYWLNGVEKYFL